MAIVVGDPWQGLGLGKRLTAELTRIAAREGVTRMSATMLADNRRAFRLMRNAFRFPFDADSMSGGVREIVAAASPERSSARAGRADSPGVSRHRSIAALLVDVPAGHAALLQRALDADGWDVRAVAVHGSEALSAALQRRGWDAVLYGGEGEGAVPSRKALALVRLADPHLPFIAVSPHVRPGELAAVIRGLPGAVPTVVDPATLPATLNRELEQARMRRRVGGAHRLLAAQQAIADHLAAAARARDALRARAGDARRLARLELRRRLAARTARVLRCASAWHAPSARRPVSEFAVAARELEFAAGQGLPGRVWGFRRPVWTSDVPAAALRAGLVTAAAFPIALGDECLGVIELYAADARESNAEVAAMFGTVGGQLAQYLARSRRSFDGAEALVVGLDATGRVELANGSARGGARRGPAGPRLVPGRRCPRPTRDEARAEFGRLMAGEPGALPDRTGAFTWRWSPSRDTVGAGPSASWAGASGV